MGLWAFLIHLANFILPALVVAGLLTPSVVGWRGLRCVGPAGQRLWRVWWLLCVAGIAALSGGLVAFGRDGKMLTYAALVVVMGSLAAWLGRR